MKRRFIFSILLWLNYHCGTWFCESQSERVVRDWLRDNKIRFTTQERISFYRVDFVAYHGKECEVIIEIDGPHHERLTKEDKARDALLRNYGYRIVRLQASALWDGDKSRNEELSKLEFLK